MSKIIYRIVRHDGGWAYQVSGTYSEPYPTREAARLAACLAAKEQSARSAEEPTLIEYEDDNGKWHREVADADDRPEAVVKG
jgi:hypothetical protein